MDFYGIGKAIFLTARFEATGSTNKKAFASFQVGNFFYRVQAARQEGRS